jgi:AcrR family transcriptional regulator
VSAPRSTRSDILKVAVTVFAELGYDGASIRDIADGLGISKGNLTYHFATKDELLYEIIADSIAMFVQAAESWLKLPGKPSDVLRHAFRAHVELICLNTDIVRVYYDDFSRLPAERQASLQAGRTKYENVFFQLIANYQPEKGSATSRRTALRAQIVFDMLNGPYRLDSHMGALSPQALAEVVSAMALRSLDA